MCIRDRCHIQALFDAPGNGGRIQRTGIISIPFPFPFIEVSGYPVNDLSRFPQKAGIELFKVPAGVGLNRFQPFMFPEAFLSHPQCQQQKLRKAVPFYRKN